MTERVLAVVAHPDDEVLGVGGTLARHAAAGDQMQVLIMAEGATARGDAATGEDGAASVSALTDAAARAATILGYPSPHHAFLPDNRLDTLPLLDIVKQIEAMVASFEPTRVYTHHGGDLNIDHRIVHEAVVTTCRPLPEGTVCGLYAFETPSSTEWRTPSASSLFIPNRFVDITHQLEQKMAALACYAQEMRPFPHARSTEAVAALARQRGASVGLEAAEALSVIREIER